MYQCLRLAPLPGRRVGGGGGHQEIQIIISYLVVFDQKLKILKIQSTMMDKNKLQYVSDSRDL